MLTIFGAPGRYIQGPDALDTLGRQAALFGRRAGDRRPHACHPGRARRGAVRRQPGAGNAADRRRRPDARDHRSAARRPAGSTPTWSSRWAAARRWTPARRWRARCMPPDHRADRGVERRPTSKNYVLDADHNLLAVEHMLFNPTIVLVDTTVIASAPAAFFRAGLGDAVSKKFEAEQCRRHGGSNVWRQAAPGRAIAGRGLPAHPAGRRRPGAGSGRHRPAHAAFERAVEP